MILTFTRSVSGFLLLGLFSSFACADDWPQWLGPQRDAIWRETGILDKFPAGGPKVRWRTPVGPGYGGPSVAQGKVFVMDRVLDGGAKNPAKGSATKRDKVAGKERVVCLDESSGKILWTHQYPASYDIAYPSGPRVTPLVDKDKVYTLGAMGDLFCLDASSGKVVWSKNFIKDHGAAVPLYGWSTHAIVDGDQLICVVGGKDGTVVSYNKDTGNVLWTALKSKEAGYSGAMMEKIGDKRQLIIWHGEAVNGLDPANGKLIWSEPFKTSFGMAIPTPRRDGDYLYINAYFGGCKMLKFDAKSGVAKLLWKGGKGACMATPIIKDDHIYGVDNQGVMRCLDAKTGDEVWRNEKSINAKPASWANVFLIAHEDKVWLANEHGDLILAKLSPKGYEEITRAHIIAPDNKMPSRPVVWSHPAFANRSVYARNDQEVICVSMAAEQ